MKVKLVLISLFLLITVNANSAWIGVTAKVETILLYDSSDSILVILDSPGAAVAECSNNQTFAINGTLPADRRNQMLSALMMAKASGQSVTIMFNDVGGCVSWGASSNVYRKIERVGF
jgi:hypothetical protein